MTPLDSMASRLEALCAVPSPTGSEKPLCDELEKWARARFPGVRRIENSLVVRVDSERSPGESGRPILALCGHLDTVPIPAADEGKPSRRDGTRLIAPGASDMKSGIALAMELAERLPAGERFCDLLLVFYSREEGPFAENELGLVLRDSAEVRGAALAICLEPSDNVLQLGCVGSVHATVTFRGKAAHSARPWQGENAIHKAGALLGALAARPPREAHAGGLTYREVMSVTRIEGGRARNVIPDRCALNLNFRFAPDRTLEESAEEVRDLARAHGAEAEMVDLSPACPPYADHPLVERLCRLTGVPVEPKQSWTDVARLSQSGIPAVNFGPGTTSQSHQQGEWADLGELARGYELLERFLRL